MDKSNWILCPVCGNKTRNQIREDTTLINFLFTVRNTNRFRCRAVELVRIEISQIIGSILL